jgi:flagellar hook-basal body complex protein FliE
MPSISPFQPIQGIQRPEKITAPAKTESPDAFRGLLEQSVRAVSQQQDNATTAVDQFVSGEQEDPHNMMLAVQRADLSFDLFVQVRNKVVQAYQEVMRMPE